MLDDHVWSTDLGQKGIIVWRHGASLKPVSYLTYLGKAKNIRYERKRLLECNKTNGCV